MIEQHTHMLDELQLKQSIINVADMINRKRRAELLKVYESADIAKALHKMRESHIYDKGSKSKSMRKIASYPIEVDHFFTKVYGPDYYKDKDFFSKHHKEWLVVDFRHI